MLRSRHEAETPVRDGGRRPIAGTARRSRCRRSSPQRTQCRGPGPPFLSELQSSRTQSARPRSRSPRPPTRACQMARPCDAQPPRRDTRPQKPWRSRLRLRLPQRTHGLAGTASATELGHAPAGQAQAHQGMPHRARAPPTGWSFAHYSAVSFASFGAPLQIRGGLRISPWPPWPLSPAALRSPRFRKGRPAVPVARSQPSCSPAVPPC